MRRFWKALRWGAFLFALAVDALLFATSKPFSTTSFVATGLASLIMFLGFLWLANLFRGASRIRRILEENEVRVHETCVHWMRLLSNIRADRAAVRWIGLPVLVALMVTVYEGLWFAWLIGDRLGAEAPWFKAIGAPFHLLPHNSVLIGFYIPLIFAIPPAIAHVAEWSTHRYVITPLRIIIHHGIFDYHMHGILLSRVVDAQQDYSFWQQVLNYGDIVFRETSGEVETLECVWGPKKFAKIAVRYSHALEGPGERTAEEVKQVEESSGASANRIIGRNIMRRLVALPLLTAVLLSGCSNPKPVVVLDSWWNAANAKRICQTAKEWMKASQGLIDQVGCAKVKSCPEMSVRANACAASDTGGLDAYEARLAADLAGCSAIRFVQFRDPNEQREATADAARQWQLMIQYEPGASSQIWTLNGPQSEYARSTGMPDDVANQVCRIVGSRAG